MLPPALAAAAEAAVNGLQCNGAALSPAGAPMFPTAPSLVAVPDAALATALGPVRGRWAALCVRA